MRAAAMRATVHLRTGKFDETKHQYGLHSARQVALAAGLEPGALYRARGGAPVGERVIASLLTVFGEEKFEDLFLIDHEIDTDPRDSQDPATDLAAAA